MKVRPHPRYRELVQRLGRINLQPATWSGITFRSVELRHAAADQIVSGEGSFRCGGRWNAPDTFPVIYSSTRPATAVEEAYQLAADYELAPDDLQPRVICAIDWDLALVLDLTGGTMTWMNLTEWIQEDFRRVNDSGSETLAQAFGRAARNAGVSSILCPSARVRGGVNLVVFRDRLRKGDTIRVVREDELKKYLG